MGSSVVSLKCMYQGIHKLCTDKGGRGVCSNVCIYCFSNVTALLNYVQRWGPGSKSWLIWAYVVYEWLLRNQTGSCTDQIQMHFCQKGFLRNFEKLTGKHLYQKHRCFPVTFAKFLRAVFFREHLQWLLLCIVTS